MARIAIYIGRHLCTAPRPVKEADALAAAGHKVTVHGLWSDPRLVARDRLLMKDRPWRFVPYADCHDGSLRSRFGWFALRARNRFARALFARTGRALADLYGYGSSALLSHAAASDADLLLFHSEGGLLAADVLKRHGRRVGMDFEDWFSRDLPPEQREGRPIAELARLEASALRFGPYVLATSHAMAEALAAAYGGPIPSVIYNTFPADPAAGMVPTAEEDEPVALHWFSQTLGRGRGLETLFAALPGVSFDWRLNLLADDPGNAAADLLRELPASLRSRVEVVPSVPNPELPAAIARHDIGLALDVSAIPNRNLTITNKLFQYLQAGLAVVASDTAGHAEVLTQAPEAGVMFTAGDPASLAEALNTLGTDRTRLLRARRAARDAASTLFAHERQVPLYAAIAARALA